MNIDLNFSPSTIKATLGHFFKRFHFILFFVFSVGGLAVCVFLLYQIIGMSDQPNGYTSTSNSTQFDQATIDQLRALGKPGESSNKLDMSGRVNPFAE